jgi:hypothetical protein
MSRVAGARLIAVGVSLLLLAAPAGAWGLPATNPASSWVIQPSPNVGSSSQLFAVTSTSVSNAWAVGQDGDVTSVPRPLIEHYGGSSWAIQASPQPGTAGHLWGVKAVSASNAWAVGSYAPSGGGGLLNGLILHYNGKSWVTQKRAPGAEEFFAVGLSSATSVWAVGTTASEVATYIEHYNGAAWTQQPSPSPGVASELRGVSAASKTNAWAVGDYTSANFYEHPLLMHFDGSSWQLQSIPALDGFLFGVSALSASNVWAVGYSQVGTSKKQVLILHFDGTSWTQVPGPKGGTQGVLSGVKAVSASDVWAVGSQLSGGIDRTLVEHFDGTSWSVASSPDSGSKDNQLNGVASSSSANSFAVGFVGEFNSTTLILHCAC